MDFPLIPFAVYVFVTTFTPGPNNISAAGFGMELGYRKALPYLIGIFSGFVLIMTLSALASDAVQEFFPGIFPFIRYAGSAYILWLAFNLVKNSTTDKEKVLEARKPTFIIGLILQFANPKVIVYGLTVFSTFIHPYFSPAGTLFLFSLLLAACSFLSISLWATLGSSLNRFIQNPKGKRYISFVLAALLVYSAIAIIR
ncbi:MAG: LysE family translocator [Bacteroidetes bacterium]|nr:LysE family translocator [Bacteroidota bacterium]